MAEVNTTFDPTTISSVNSIFTNSTMAPVVSSRKTDVLGIAILSIAFIIGFPGNTFVIWTILTRIKKRTVTCLLILHLAIADIIVLLTAPFFLIVLGTGKWIFWKFICNVCYYTSSLSMYASIYIIMFMSMDRFLAVAQPFTFQKIRTKPIVRGIAAAIWLLASLLSTTVFFYHSVDNSTGLPQCIPHHVSPKHMVFQYTFENLTGFFIPFTIIFFCYVYIRLRLRTAKFQTKQKTSHLVIMIIVIFALFWLPYHLVNILQVSGEIYSSEHLTMVANKARNNAIAFAFLSSSANPILYVFAGGNFIKTAGVGFMAKLFERAGPEPLSLHKISQVFRQKSHTESIKLEKCAEQGEPSKDMLTNQTD